MWHVTREGGWQGRQTDMLVYEYKLDGTRAQYARIASSIRVAQVVRNKCLRKWIDEQGVSANDLQIYCSQLAKDFAFATKLNAQARQAAADRAWFAIKRFSDNCRAHTPGRKGYPRFQHDNRSVEYTVTGWKLEPDGKHLTFTDGCEIGRVRLIGTRDIATFPLSQIKRVRLIRRADRYYVQFCAEAERRVEHAPTGHQVGIDLGLKVFYTPSDGQTVHTPLPAQSRATHHGSPATGLAQVQPGTPSSRNRTTITKPDSASPKRICRSSGSAKTSPAKRQTRSSGLAT